MIPLLLIIVGVGMLTFAGVAVTIRQAAVIKKQKVLEDAVVEALKSCSDLTLKVHDIKKRSAAVEESIQTFQEDITDFVLAVDEFMNNFSKKVEGGELTNFFGKDDKEKLN